MRQSSLLLPVNAPTLLLSLGQGVLIPILPLYAKSLGISFALVSVAIGAAGIGTLLADLPAGVSSSDSVGGRRCSSAAGRSR